MAESAEERSKRRLVSYLQAYEWTHQISIFYLSLDESREAILDSQKIRKAIPRAWKDQAFLWVLRTKNYLTAWTMVTLDDGNTDIILPGYAGWLPDEDSSKSSFLMPYHVFFTNKQTYTEEFGDFVEVLLGKQLYVKKRRLKPKKIESTISAIKKHKLHDLHKVFSDKTKINRYSLINKHKLTRKVMRVF